MVYGEKVYASKQFFEIPHIPYTTYQILKTFFNTCYLLCRNRYPRHLRFFDQNFAARFVCFQEKMRGRGFHSFHGSQDFRHKFCDLFHAFGIHDDLQICPSRDHSHIRHIWKLCDPHRNPIKPKLSFGLAFYVDEGGDFHLIIN